MSCDSASELIRNLSQLLGISSDLEWHQNSLGFRQNLIHPSEFPDVKN